MSEKFTGQEWDTEAGLDYFNARYFAAALGRFTSPDPGNAGADLMSPQSWNGYAYVGNNPLVFVPSGMDCITFDNGSQVLILVTRAAVAAVSIRTGMIAILKRQV